MYAIGTNAEAAQRVGINVTRMTLSATGCRRLRRDRRHAAGLAPVDCIADRGRRLRAAGDRGGGGGRGQPVRRPRHRLGCFVGALLFTTMGNGAVLLGVDPFWEMVIEGLLIAAVVYLDNLTKLRRAGLR